jgi:hypothetical protein
MAYVLGGLALAGVAGVAFFGLEAQAEYSHLNNSGCAPRCSPSDVDLGKHDALFADVSLGVAVVATVATVWIVLVRPSRRATAARAPLVPGVTPLYGGGAATWTGSF